MHILPFDQQLENVRQCMVDAECSLMLDYGKTTAQAERLIAANLGLGLLNRCYPWWRLADAYVGAHRQWREMLAQHEARLGQAERDARQQLLRGCPFRAGDQVRRRDGAVGTVRYAFVQTGDSRRPDRVKVVVDWPAPQRIGGDGWHRSTVLASSLILAT